MAYFTQLLTQRAHTLRLPKKDIEDIQRYVRMHQDQKMVNAERAPFRRQLDFWTISLGAALAQGLPPLDNPSSKWGRRFIDTRSVDMPDTLCDLLAVAAFHHRGTDDSAFEDPAHIIEVGNRLAGAGCSSVLEYLNSSELHLTPLAKALEFAASMLKDTQSRPPTEPGSS